VDGDGGFKAFKVDMMKKGGVNAGLITSRTKNLSMGRVGSSYLERTHERKSNRAHGKNRTPHIEKFVS